VGKRERQERKRNVIKGFKEEGKSVKIRIKEILIGANMEVEKARIVKAGKEEGGEGWQW